LRIELPWLEVYVHNHTIASPDLDLIDLNYQLALPDLNGRIKVENASAVAAGQWRPGQVTSVGEPIRPLLRLDQEIVLSKSLGIEPGDQEFKFEIEFDVQGARLVDWKPFAVDAATAGPFAEELTQEDYGRYAIVDIEVLGTHFVDPTSGKPLHRFR
jgi:hypothetical protein